MMNSETIIQSQFFKKECKKLLDIYKLKEYRRYNQYFKAKYGKHWKIECSLAEFVWNYCKTPSYAALLMDHLDAVILKERSVKKWLTNINQNIDIDVAFLNLEDAGEYMNENSEASYAHLLGQEPERLGEDFTTTTYIEEEDGDLFHGLIIDSDDLDAIGGVIFTFETPSQTCIYVYHKQDILNNICVWEEDIEEPTLYYLPMFKHPIPLVHLTDHNVKLSIEVGTDQENIETSPLLTIVDKKLRLWLKNRRLLLTLKDGDMLRVGPKKTQIR